MRAQRLKATAPIEQRPLQLVDVPVPEPGPGQVRLRVLACGACRTDLHTVEGDLELPALPLTPGHQVVGVVDAQGEGVSQPAVGDRVGVVWLYSACGRCVFCRKDKENLCVEGRFTGLHADGGYAEYMLAEAEFVYPLPAGLDDAQTTPLLCGGVIGYRALRLSEVRPGEVLGLYGFGNSAHVTIQVARHMDCRVMVFTRSENHQAHALELGAAWAGSPCHLAPEPLDAAIMFAPAGELVPPALEALRPGGTLALAGIHMSPLPEMPYSLLYGERTLRSVANSTREDAREVLRLAAEIPIRTQVSCFPLDQANQVLLDMKHSRFKGDGVLLP
jgi:propanol-preferring alcohol dehydrogenase